MKPLLIYVAGPYRAKTPWQVEQNIHAARAFGVTLAKLGAYPVIPHSNTAHFDGEADDALWLAGTLRLVEKCDGVVMLPTWRQSSGAQAEHAKAIDLGMPVFVARENGSFGALEDWLHEVACVAEDVEDVR